MNTSQEIRNALNICLSSRNYSMLIWGQQHLQFCNAAILEVLPEVFKNSNGKPAKDFWDDKYAAASVIFNEVLEKSKTIQIDHQAPPFPVKENMIGSLWSCSFIPVNNSNGVTEGVFIDISLDSNATIDQTYLNTSMKMYEDLAENLPVGGIFIFDTELNIVMAGGRGFEREYIEARKLKGKRIAEVFNQDMADTYEPLIHKAFRGEASKREHQKNEKIFLIHFMPLEDQDKNVSAVLGFFSDITENARSKAALRQSEERLRLASKASQIGVYSRNLKTGMGYRSPEFKSIFGYAAGEDLPIENEIPAMIHPQDKEAVETEMLDRLNRRTNPVFSSEYRIIRPDGQLRWVMIRGEMEFDAEGKAESLYGIAMDITERKKTEEKLKQNERFLEAILDQMPAGVSIAEAPSGKLLLHNKEAVRLIRHPLLASDTYEGYAQYGALHEDLTPYAPEEYPIARSLKGEVVEQEEMKYRRGDNTITNLLVNAAPVYNEKEEIIFSVSTFYDISEIKKVHEELKLAKEEAEQAAHAKEDFLSNMSHEIRTPLHSVIGLSKLLLKKKPRQDQLNQLKALNFSARHLMNLINDILDFSKIQAGKAELEENIVVLPQLMENIKQAYLPYAHKNSSTIHLSIAKDVPKFIKTDRLKLSQIINNLISNAVKFTSDGKIHINVSHLKKTNHQHLLLFSVKDTGIGIPKDKLHSIFEKFSQAYDGSDRQFVGTGLGLAISEMLAKLMGSSIEVESTEGKGSCFSFRLKVETSKPEQLKETIKKPEKTLNFDEARILIAEDVDVNRMLIEEFLQEWWKITPDMAGNGKEALEKATENHYDLILMDLRMPVMDGYEAAKKIKQLPGNEQIPIIAFTANTTSAFSKNMNSGLFNGIITKPVEPDKLQKALLKYIEPKTAEEPEVSFDNMISYIGNDPKKVKALLSKSLLSLKVYQDEYRKALSENNEEKLRDVKHKAKMMVEMLQMKDIQKLFEDTQIMIKTGKLPAGRMIRKADGIFTGIIRKIENYIEELR